nr:MAG TPA: hypothetical protein [Caudoviricetes sp.]
MMLFVIAYDFFECLRKTQTYRRFENQSIFKRR